MYVGDDRFALLQVGGSESVDREHDEGRTDEAGEEETHKSPVETLIWKRTQIKTMCLSGVRK